MVLAFHEPFHSFHYDDKKEGPFISQLDWLMTNMDQGEVIVSDTDADGSVAKSSAKGLVGTGFASRYRLQPKQVFKGTMSRCNVTTPSALLLTSNRVTLITNLLS